MNPVVSSLEQLLKFVMRLSGYGGKNRIEKFRISFLNLPYFTARKGATTQIRRLLWIIRFLLQTSCMIAVLDLDYPLLRKCPVFMIAVFFQFRIYESMARQIIARDSVKLPAVKWS